MCSSKHRSGRSRFARRDRNWPLSPPQTQTASLNVVRFSVIRREVHSCTAALFHTHTYTLATIFISQRYSQYVIGTECAVSAAPRAPPISSFKIILRPKGHSPLSYPLRQITLARRLAPTVISSLAPTTESWEIVAQE